MECSIFVFNLCSSSSSSSSSENGTEDGEIDDESSKKKSRVDPSEIPEVKNTFLMRGAQRQRDADKKEESDDDNKHRDRKRDSRQESRGYVTIIRIYLFIECW